jgi:hypothetical protein
MSTALWPTLAILVVLALVFAALTRATRRPPTYDQPTSGLASIDDLVEFGTPMHRRLCPDCGNWLRSCCDSLVMDEHRSSCPLYGVDALTSPVDRERARRGLPPLLRLDDDEDVAA